MNETGAALVDSRITLRDGRALAYAEYGKAAGQPVFLMHGTPGARLLYPDAIMAGAANTRIVTLDRPGYGGSDITSHGGMLERADEVGELADALGIGRFAVIGTSGGGPYAAACALRLSERVTAVGLMSSPAPLPDDEPNHVSESVSGVYSDGEIEAARTLSWTEFLAWFKENNGNAPSDVDQFLAFAANVMPECDKQVLALPKVQASFRRTLPEAFRQGMVGWAWDSWTLARPWGFSVRDIDVRTYLWHGMEDQLVPVKQGHFLAETIPNCVATFYPKTGHAIPPYRWNEILAALVTE